MAQKALAKDSIIKLQQFQGKFIRVKFQGGREITGVLKSADMYLNMILDDAIESIRDANDPYLITSEKRKLGLLIVRGNLVTCCYPMDGTHDIDNPFLSVLEDQEEEEVGLTEN